MASLDASKENDPYVKSPGADHDKFSFQPAVEFDFGDPQSLQQEVALEDQRRQSLAQLNGIRSKIGIWESDDKPKKRFPIGASNANRSLLMGGGMRGSGAPGRSGLQNRRPTLASQPAWLSNLEEAPPTTEQQLALQPRAPAPLQGRRSPAASLAAVAAQDAVARRQPRPVIPTASTEQTAAELNGVLSASAPSALPAASTSCSQAPLSVKAMPPLRLRTSPDDAPGYTVAPLDASDITIEVPTIEHGMSLPSTPTTAASSPVASDASTVSVTCRTSAVALPDHWPLGATSGAPSPLSLPSPVLPVQSAHVESLRDDLDMTLLEFESQASGDEAAISPQSQSGTECQLTWAASTSAPTSGTSTAKCSLVNLQPDNTLKAAAKTSSSSVVPAEAVASGIHTPLQTAPPCPVSTSAKLSAVQSAMGSIMGAAWSAAGLWSGAKQPVVQTVKQSDRSADDGCSRTSEDDHQSIDVLQPLQLNMQSPPRIPTPCSQTEAADSPEVFSTPAAAFPPSPDGTASPGSPHVAPLPCGLTAAAMADAMPNEAHGQEQEGENQMTDGSCGGVEDILEASLLMLQLSPLQDLTTTVEGDGHGDSTSVSGPSNRSSETPLTHEPSADPAEALSAAVPQFSASTALDEQENSMLLEGKEVATPKVLITAASVVTPPTIEVLPPTTPCEPSAPSPLLELTPVRVTDLTAFVATFDSSSVDEVRTSNAARQTSSGQSTPTAASLTVPGQVPTTIQARTNCPLAPSSAPPTVVQGPTLEQSPTLDSNHQMQPPSRPSQALRLDFNEVNAQLGSELLGSPVLPPADMTSTAGAELSEELDGISAFAVRTKLAISPRSVPNLAMPRGDCPTRRHVTETLRTESPAVHVVPAEGPRTHQVAAMVQLDSRGIPCADDQHGDAARLEADIKGLPAESLSRKNVQSASEEQQTSPSHTLVKSSVLPVPGFDSPPADSLPELASPILISSLDGRAKAPMLLSPQTKQGSISASSGVLVSHEAAEVQYVPSPDKSSEMQPDVPLQNSPSELSGSGLLAVACQTDLILQAENPQPQISSSVSQDAHALEPQPVIGANSDIIGDHAQSGAGHDATSATGSSKLSHEPHAPMISALPTVPTTAAQKSQDSDCDADLLAQESTRQPSLLPQPSRAVTQRQFASVSANCNEDSELNSACGQPSSPPCAVAARLQESPAAVMTDVKTAALHHVPPPEEQHSSRNSFVGSDISQQAEAAAVLTVGDIVGGLPNEMAESVGGQLPVKPGTAPKSLSTATEPQSPPVPALAAKLRRQSLGGASPIQQDLSAPLQAAAPAQHDQSRALPPAHVPRLQLPGNMSSALPPTGELQRSDCAQGTDDMSSLQTVVTPLASQYTRSSFPYPEMTVAKMGPPAGGGPGGWSSTEHGTPFGGDAACERGDESAASQLDMLSLPPETPRDAVHVSAGTGVRAEVQRCGLTPDIRALRRRLTSDGSREPLTALSLSNPNEISPAIPASSRSSTPMHLEDGGHYKCSVPRPLPNRNRASMSPETLSLLAQRNSLFEGADADAEADAFKPLMEEGNTEQAIIAELKRQNELLASESASARGAVSDLLDRTSRAQVDGQSEVRLLAAKLAKAQSDLEAAQQELKQVQEAKVQEKAQFRMLHEVKYLPLKKRCAAFESETRRLEEAASISAQVGDLRDKEHSRVLQDSRRATAAALASQQDLQSAHAAISSQLKAALAEVDSLRAQLCDANDGAQQSELTARNAVALTKQVEEIMLSHDAMMQSRDRAISQASAKEEEICRQAASLKKAELLLKAGKTELERGIINREALNRRIAGLQSQLSAAEKDRTELLEICHGKLAGISSL